MRRSAQRFDVKKPRMHSCSDPSAPVVITCHLPDRRALLRNALDEVDSRWELALQTQRKDRKVVWGLIVVESLWFCMRHRRQAQLTGHTQSANPPGMSSGWLTACSPLTNGSIRRRVSETHACVLNDGGEPVDYIAVLIFQWTLTTALVCHCVHTIPLWSFCNILLHQVENSQTISVWIITVMR